MSADTVEDNNSHNDQPASTELLEEDFELSENLEDLPV